MRRILTHGVILVLVCAAGLSAGCGNSTPAKDIAGTTTPLPVNQASHTATYVFECGEGSTFVARIEGETAWLFLRMGTVRLPHVPSGSGARYADGATTFWSKGEEAMLALEEGVRRQCRNNRAKAIWADAKFRGADFRAVGNEPGWYLEISAGAEIVYVGDYGETEYRFATPDPVEDQDGQKTTYRVADEGHELEIVLEARRCRDTMSGESFQTSVTVVLNGKKYRGCGRALH